MSTVTLTIRLDEKLRDHLERLAEVMQRSKSFLAAQAISEYVKLQEWQINEIKAGIAEADLGSFIEHESVKERWK